MGNELAILLVRNSSERERWSLPWRTPQTGETLDAAAASTAEQAAYIGCAMENYERELDRFPVLRERQGQLF